MTNHLKIGELGENLACDYLIKKGYKILFRNYRRPWGEIDIVVRVPDCTLAFVEVKTIQAKEAGEEKFSPEENVTFAKMSKMRRMIEGFVPENQSLLDSRRGYRADLIAILLRKNDSEVLDIRHYESI